MYTSDITSDCGYADVTVKWVNSIMGGTSAAVTSSDIDIFNPYGTYSAWKESCKTSGSLTIKKSYKAWRNATTWALDDADCSYGLSPLCGTWGSVYKLVGHPGKSPQERMRDIIRSRQGPFIHVRSGSLPGVTEDQREVRARQTLRRLLGEQDYRQFLRRGHVSVHAKSGLVYQIFPGHGVTAVYRNGEMIERLCVVLTGDFPPTDSLIMRYLLIMNDEQDFRSHAIKHQIIAKRKLSMVTDERSLAEIYNDLRGRKAA